MDRRSNSAKHSTRVLCILRSGSLRFFGQEIEHRLTRPIHRCSSLRLPGETFVLLPSPASYTVGPLISRGLPSPQSLTTKGVVKSGRFHQNMDLIESTKRWIAHQLFFNRQGADCVLDPTGLIKKGNLTLHPPPIPHGC